MDALSTSCATSQPAALLLLQKAPDGVYNGAQCSAPVTLRDRLTSGCMSKHGWPPKAFCTSCHGQQDPSAPE
eukprot:1428154-Amphidinium_carterae.1